MADRDVLSEIERGAREIFDAMMELIMRFINEVRKKNQSLEQQMLARIHQTCWKEMERNISEQLRRQISNLRISTIEWKDRSGISLKLHWTNDAPDGREYTFQRLEGDKLLFQRADQQGDPVYLDIQELEKVVPALEGRIEAMGTLAKLDEKQIVQSLADTFERAKREGISLAKAYRDVMGKKVKHEIHQSRLHDLERAKNFHDYYQKRKTDIEYELKKIKLEKMDLQTKLEVGSISKKAFKDRNKDLNKLSKKLTKEMEELNKGRKKLDSQLAKEIGRHCPGLSAKNLDFEDKIALAESVFQYPEGLNKEQLRQAFAKDGNEKGIQRLDQAEGKTQERGVQLDQEEITISIQDSFSD